MQFYRGRLFEPLTVIAAVSLVSFTARPLQLFLSADDLKSYYFQFSALNSLLKTENQEIALFVTRDLKEPLEPALTRAMGAVTIFVCLVVVGYLLPWGRRWAGRLARVGQGVANRIDVQPAVIASLLIAAIGQIAVLVKVGGPAQAADHMLDQEVLGTGLAYQVLLGFGTAAVLIWAAWDPPRTTRARVAFLLVLLEVCGFYALAGTRTRVFLTLLMMAVIVPLPGASLAKARATARRRRGGRVRERHCWASARRPPTSRSARRSARRPSTSWTRAASSTT